MRLPNPYAEIEGYKTIEWNIKSKFKSRFADYVNHTSTKSSSNINKGAMIKQIATDKEKELSFSKIEHLIHFTHSVNRDRSVSNSKFRKKNDSCSPQSFTKTENNTVMNIKNKKG